MKLSVPEWYNREPDIWSSYNGELKDIEDYLINKGFKLESAHPDFMDKKCVCVFFNIIAETKMRGYFDCIRTWVYLKKDINTIEWCIQIPAQDYKPAYKLFHDTEDIRALKYKAALELVLKQYKVRQGKTKKLISSAKKIPLEQMKLF